MASKALLLLRPSVSDDRVILVQSILPGYRPTEQSDGHVVSSPSVLSLFHPLARINCPFEANNQPSSRTTE